MVFRNTGSHVIGMKIKSPQVSRKVIQNGTGGVKVMGVVHRRQLVMLWRISSVRQWLPMR
jgi:hypothetical protein